MSTPDYPGIEELDAFIQRLSERIVPMHVSTSDIGTFRARLRSTNLGAVQLGELWANNAFTARRTSKLITSSSPEYLKVGMQLSGISAVSQGDQQTTLGPGDFILYDTNRPYEISCGGSFHMQTVVFSRDALGLPQPQLERLTTRRISGREGLGSLLAQYLVGLARQLDSGVHLSYCHLADATLDLLTASFAEKLACSPTAALDIGKAGLLHRVRTHIEHRLDDPNLDIASIAAAHHISVRTLQKLFAEQEQTVTGWIRTRRIEHCRRDLANPAFVDIPVGSIAAKWGLVDHAHFTRLFKSTYGSAPRDYRIGALAQPKKVQRP